MPEIETLRTKVVYANRWMCVREDAIRRADGTEGVYGVVEKKNFAVVVARQGDQIVLVEQYRYPVQGRYWEFPQGSWDSDVEDPIALARAELREEAGLVAERLTQVGRLFPAYGFCTQGFAIFLAQELEQHAPELEAEEQGLLAQWFDITQVEAMIRDGVIVDAATVCAFGLMRLNGLL